MTISSDVRKSGPFAGTGLVTVYSFDFKIFSSSDLLAIKLEVGTGVETVLVENSDYTVTLNADQNVDPGGSITLAAALPGGFDLTMTSQLDYLQPMDLTNGGGFYPQVITNSLDRLTILAQQTKEVVDRSLSYPLSDPATSTTLPPVAQRAGVVLTFDETGAPIAGPAVDSVGTVAGNVHAINTVAEDIDAVNYVADNFGDIAHFTSVYIGPRSSDPPTRLDGTPLQDGDLFFLTTTNLMRVYTSTGWVDAQTPAPITITTQTFSGTGAQTAFTLSGTPASVGSIFVTISGVVQTPTADYTISGTTLTFTTAPPSGTNNIFVRWFSAVATAVPPDASVTTEKLQNAAVITEKLADDSVTNAKLAADAVGTAEVQDNAITLAEMEHGTQGDVLVYGAAGAPTRLGAGTSGQWLKTLGAGNNPQWASLPSASTSASGIVELTTAAEALAGTDAVRALTAAAFSGSKSLGTSGYYKLPGGFIIQWFAVTSTLDTNETFAIPEAFPTACVFATASWSGGELGQDAGLNTIGWTASTVTLNRSDSIDNNHAAKIFAVGY